MIDSEEDLMFKLFHDYEARFPGVALPNFWECGSWERVENELKKALRLGRPWVSKTPKDVVL